MKRVLVSALGRTGARLCWWAECLRLKNGPCPNCGCELTDDGRCYACEERADRSGMLTDQYDGGYVDGYTEATLRADGER